MKIVYVVESMEISGGVRAIVEQADGLRLLGHDVSIVTKHAPAEWIRHRVPVVVVPAFDSSTLPEADVAVATWFPTVVPAVRSGRARLVVHFCQGYEGLGAHASRSGEIEEAYGQPIPKMVVSEPVDRVLGDRYPGRRVVLPVGIRLADFPPPTAPRERPSVPPVVGVVGPIEDPMKAIEVALLAVAELRKRLGRVVLRRVSRLPLGAEEEERFRPDAYEVGIPAWEMAAWYRGLDLFVFSSRPEEGLGLPPLEAMAAGVPVVSTAVPAIAALPAGAAAVAPFGDWLAIADRAEQLLRDEGAWREQRTRGLEAVRAHDVSVRTREVEKFLETELAAVANG